MRTAAHQIIIEERLAILTGDYKEGIRARTFALLRLVGFEVDQVFLLEDVEFLFVSTIENLASSKQFDLL